MLLTGLAVGAGTKRLHDLIARIEKAKGQRGRRNDSFDSTVTKLAGTPYRTAA